MTKIISVKLAEISEEIISIQSEDATLFDHLVKIDSELLVEYKKIQHSDGLERRLYRAQQFPG